MKAILFDPVSGAAGDMILAALFDLGVSPADVTRILRTSGLDEFEIVFEQRQDTHGLRAGFCDVRTCSHDGHHDHRHLGDILKLIEHSQAPARAKERATAVFQRLAEAEAAVHGIGLDEVHFHEVGAVDAIVDIFGSCIALELLEAERIFCSELKHGKGTVKCAHGILPVPAPATVKLCEGWPVQRLDIEAELTTPTGAAILTTLAEGDVTGVPHRISACGVGHGKRDLGKRPNIVRATLIDIEEAAGPEPDLIDVLETDIDDDPPEVTAELTQQLRQAGALDVTLTALVMKKGRQGVRLTVLAPSGAAAQLARLILGHSSTIGVRTYQARRYILQRQPVTVQTPWGEVQAKRVERPTGTELIPEYESCRQLAQSAGVPLRRVMQAARSWQDQ